MRSDTTNTMSSHSRTSASRITTSIAALLLLSSTSQSPQLAHAQNTADVEPAPVSAVVAAAPPTTCSCSPTVFTFTLNLDGSCEVNDIDSNPGIDGSFCFVEEGVTVPAAPVPLPDPAAEEEAVVADATEPTRLRRDLLQSPSGRRRLEDTADPVVEIVSVQFLEFDTSGDLTVINQDDTYADVSLAEGDRLKFNSASSFLDTSLLLEDQMSNPSLVPGGASLILYGRRESGMVVRNRFFWMYDMNCGRDNKPVQVGDEIGWVTVAEISNAWPTFCPALPENSPTIAPKSNEPTLTPSKSPSDKPTKTPSSAPLSMSMTTTAPTPRGSLLTGRPTAPPHSGNGPAFKSKSLKSPKTEKHPKSGKGGSSSKSAKSKGGAKAAKAYNSEDDGHVKGKAGKGAKTHTKVDEGAFNMGRVIGFDAERSNDASIVCGGVFALVVSMVASALFL